MVVVAYSAIEEQKEGRKETNRKQQMVRMRGQNKGTKEKFYEYMRLWSHL